MRKGISVDIWDVLIALICCLGMFLLAAIPVKAYTPTPWGYCGSSGDSQTNTNLSAGVNYLTGGTSVFVRRLKSIAVQYTGTVGGVVLSPQLYRASDGYTIDFAPISPVVSGTWYRIMGDWVVDNGFAVRLLVLGATAGDDAQMLSTLEGVCRYDTPAPPSGGFLGTVNAIASAGYGSYIIIGVAAIIGVAVYRALRS